MNDRELIRKEREHFDLGENLYGDLEESSPEEYDDAAFRDWLEWKYWQASRDAMAKDAN